MPHDGVQASGSVEDTRADPLAQRPQYSVVVPADVGDPDKSEVGGGEQQGADRAVDGAVGDVEDAFGLRCGGQPVVQPAQVAGTGGEGPRSVNQRPATALLSSIGSGLPATGKGPAQAARRSERRPRGSRSSSAPACRRNASISGRVRSSRVPVT